MTTPSIRSAPQAGVAAWVCGEPVTVAEVHDRLAAARMAAFGSRLPHPTTTEGRNAARWVTQLLCAERIVREELAWRGIPISGRTQPLRISRALALGGVAAAVLASVPELGDWARTWPTSISEEELRAYYRNNPDLFAELGISFELARDDILATLREAAVDRAVANWLERRCARDVVLARGFEHPADPSHADATHRH